MRIIAVALCLGVSACGAAEPELGMTISGLAAVPEASRVDIQLHPSDRACSVLHDTFLLGNRVNGATGTDVGIDTELLFGSIANGVYTITAIAHDTVNFYADGCESSVELIAGEVTTVRMQLTRFATPIAEVK